MGIHTYAHINGGCLACHPPTAARATLSLLISFVISSGPEVGHVTRTRRLPFEGGNGMGYICSISYALCIHEIIIMKTDLCCAISCSC